MRRACLVLLLPALMVAAMPARAQQNGWQQALPERAPSQPPQLRGGDAPTPRPDPITDGQQNTPQSQPPALRSDAAAMPRPASDAGWQQAAANTVPNRNLSPPPPLRTDGAMPTARPDPGSSQKSFPGGINAAFDIVYAPNNGHPLTLDLYRPPARNYPLPLVVIVSDGVDSRHAAVFPDMPGTVAGLAAQGYVVAAINTRTPAQARFPAALQDIKTAIRFLRAHAAEMGFDTTRVALWGISSGGQLAALAGVSCGVPLFGPGDNDCVQAVVDWYGPVEAPIACDPASCAPGVARTASPYSYIGVTSPPFLIEQGGADPVAAQSQRLQAALQAAGVAADLQVFPNVGHDFVANGAPDAGVTRQALQKMAAFLAQVFPPVAIGVRARAAGRGSVY